MFTNIVSSRWGGQDVSRSDVAKWQQGPASLPVAQFLQAWFSSEGSSVCPPMLRECNMSGQRVKQSECNPEAEMVAGDVSCTGFGSG